MLNSSDENLTCDASEKNASEPEKIDLSILKGKTFSVASLGCPKNLVDSESVAGTLAQAGCVFSPDADSVDVFLLNTCGFLRSAVAEAEEFIADALEQKASGNIGVLLVAGCAVSSDGAALAEKYRGVDAWIGPFDEPRSAEILAEIMTSAGQTSAEPAAQPETESEATPTQDAPAPATAALPELNVLSPAQVALARASAAPAPVRIFDHAARNLSFHDRVRQPLTEPHVAYLKIADGCDRFCSYCAIPKIRGRYVSKPFENILEEAKILADRGVRELVLIAQETTFWGKDLYGAPDLKRLLEALKTRGLFEWIRVLYAYPLYWDKDLTSLFKLEEPGRTSIIPYVDMPLQHCNSELLKKMNRQVDRAMIEATLDQIREEIPDVVLRTSLITGFPGETDAMFTELVDFTEKQRFARAGVFEFSPEPGTPAADMPDQIDAKTKRRRFERLYAKQERISHQFARSFIGKTVRVLLDSRAVAENGSVMKNVCLGRTYADAPDVDPIVYVTGRGLNPGEFETCEIVDAQGLDLIAVPVDQEKVFVSKDERREAYEREESKQARKEKKNKKSGNDGGDRQDRGRKPRGR